MQLGRADMSVRIELVHVLRQLERSGTPEMAIRAAFVREKLERNLETDLAVQAVAIQLPQLRYNS